VLHDRGQSRWSASRLGHVDAYQIRFTRALLRGLPRSFFHLLVRLELSLEGLAGLVAVHLAKAALGLDHAGDPPNGDIPVAHRLRLWVADEGQASGRSGATLGPQLAGKLGELKGSEATRNCRSQTISRSSLLVAKAPQSVLKTVSGATAPGFESQSSRHQPAVFATEVGARKPGRVRVGPYSTESRRSCVVPRVKGTETLITPATCPFTNRSLYGPRTAAGDRACPRPPSSPRFLSLKHSSLG